ncbi:MAG: hypothetical protein FWG52_02125 [Proteobacteria bacterium]|nr:hypothetical protein [Pseudomonadota bacterium]
MKHLLACLLVTGCLVNPAYAAEPGITFEEFLQKLEKAEPWTQEKVEALLGVKLAEPLVPGGRADHMAYGQFVYAKGLIVSEIDLEISGSTKETNILILRLDDKSSCFKWEEIEKIYPGGYPEATTSNFDNSYIKEMPWGEWDFLFMYAVRKGCLTDIRIRTNAFIKKYLGDRQRPLFR